MTDEIKALRIGDPAIYFDPPGDCLECGGQCAPECGLHPLGCIYGGFSYSYWMIADGCELSHGTERADAYPTGGAP